MAVKIFMASFYDVIWFLFFGVCGACVWDSAEWIRISSRGGSTADTTIRRPPVGRTMNRPRIGSRWAWACRRTRVPSTIIIIPCTRAGRRRTARMTRVSPLPRANSTRQLPTQPKRTHRKTVQRRITMTRTKTGTRLWWPLRRTSGQRAPLSTVPMSAPSDRQRARRTRGSATGPASSAATQVRVPALLLAAAPPPRRWAAGISVRWTRPAHSPRSAHSCISNLPIIPSIPGWPLQVKTMLINIIRDPVAESWKWKGRLGVWSGGAQRAAPRGHRWTFCHWNSFGSLARLPGVSLLKNTFLPKHFPFSCLKKKK